MIKLNWNFLRDRDLPFHGGSMVNVSHFSVTDIILQFILCNNFCFVRVEQFLVAQMRCLILEIRRSPKMSLWIS